MAPGPRFFYRGGFYNSPAEIQQLKFNQLRSHLYPRNPYLAAEALEYDGRATAILPQRMMFSRWKTPPMRAAWLENARSALQAPVATQQRVQEMQDAAGLPPMLPLKDAPAALGADQIPETPQAPELEEQPLSRGVLPSGRIRAGELSALVREYRENILARHRKAQDRSELARAEVHNQVTAITGMVSGDPSKLPWYRRGVG